MRLVSELRRRNVFRMMALYLVTAWLIMQVAEVLMGLTPMPDWVGEAVLGALAIGFPIALLFAWIYEITPEGLKLEKDVDRPASITHITGRRMDFIAIAILVAAVIVFAVDKWWVAAPPPRSIAVIPFKNMSGDPAQEYFSDGISEELLNLLSQIPGLRVISRSSSFTFKGKDVAIPQIAEQLNVTHVLEGSVRKVGNRVRITAQLIEAGSDSHLWSESYDRELNDIFQIQDEIAASVVDALRIELLGAASQTRKVDEEVYSSVLRARYFWNRKSPGDEERAMEYYKRALDLDSSYAPAWAGLSASYFAQGANGEMPRETALEKAREAAEEALSLDPGLSDAHVRIGMLLLANHNWEAAFDEYDQALALDPNNPLAMAVRSPVWLTGRLDEAISWYRKATDIDPLTTTWPTNMSHLLIKAGRLDEAEEAARKALDLSPQASAPRENLACIALLRGQFDEALELTQSLPEGEIRTFLLTVIYHAMGRQDESDAALLRLTRIAETEESPLVVAQAHAYRGEIDEAFEWLDRTNDAHRQKYGVNEEIGAFKFNPYLSNLHNDPRWDALLNNLYIPLVATP